LTSQTQKTTDYLPETGKSKASSRRIQWNVETTNCEFAERFI
jgi:hypothetical protein